MRSASSWNVVLVVRPQPGQAVTLGENDRCPSACSNSQHAYTSSRRSPPGFGVSEIRIVSPIPSASSTPSDADDHTSPFIPMPASVNPRCSGCCVFPDKSRYTVIKSRGREVLHEIIIWSLRKPLSSASSVDCSAESTMHSLMISSLSLPRFRSVFSCILRITSSWFSEPPFTPIRTGLPLSTAILQMVENCSSRRCPAPTFPGLILYLSSAAAHPGYFVSSTCPL